MYNRSTHNWDEVIRLRDKKFTFFTAVLPQKNRSHVTSAIFYILISTHWITQNLSCVCALGALLSVQSVLLHLDLVTVLHAVPSLPMPWRALTPPHRVPTIRTQWFHLLIVSAFVCCIGERERLEEEHDYGRAQTNTQECLPLPH